MRTCLQCRRNGHRRGMFHLDVSAPVCEGHLSVDSSSGVVREKRRVSASWVGKLFCERRNPGSGFVSAQRTGRD